MIKSFSGPDQILGIPLRLRRSIGVKSGIGDLSGTWPEPCAATLVRIGFTCDRIRAFAFRRALSRKAGDRQIKAAPKEVHRTGFPDERSAELGEYAMNRHQDAVESADRMCVI